MILTKGLILSLWFTLSSPQSYEDTLKIQGIEVLPVIRVTAPLYNWSYRIPAEKEAVIRALESSGLNIVRRGPRFASDISVDGFRGRNISVVIDGERHFNACPNRMDVPIVRINPVDINRVYMVVSSAYLASGLGGALVVNRISPVPGFRYDALLKLAALSSEEADVAFSINMKRHRISIRYSQAKPYLDALGRSYEELYGYTAEARLAYKNIEGSLSGKIQKIQYGLTIDHYQDVLFPYLMMDERRNIGFSAFLQYRKHRIYTNLYNHFMDNRLRESSQTMTMETRSSSMVLGITDRKNYDVFIRRWKADNLMQMDMSNMEMKQTMIDVFQGRVTFSRGFSLSNEISAEVRVGLERVSLESPDRVEVLQLVTQPVPLSRLFPVVSSNLKYSLRLVDLYVELGTDAVSPELLYRTLKRPSMNNLQKPYFVGNAGLRAPKKVSMRSLLRVHTNVLPEFFVTYVQGYIEPTGLQVGDIPIQTFTNVNALMTGFHLLVNVGILNLGANYTLGRNLTDNKPLSEIPPLHVTLELSRKIGKAKPYLVLNYEDAQVRVNPDLGQTPTPSWYTVDVGLNVNFGMFTLDISVENLTNQEYYRHLSYLRDPFSSGRKVYDPGRKLNIWARFRSI